MDQYVIEFEFAMLYFDMIALVELINKSDDDQLKMYIDSFQEIINQHDKTEKYVVQRKPTSIVKKVKGLIELIGKEDTLLFLKAKKESIGDAKSIDDTFALARIDTQIDIVNGLI